MSSIAQRYKDASDLQSQDGLKLLDQLSPAKNSRVLDLGCGTGYLTSVIAEMIGPGGKVVGVDPDKERIKIAQETYGDVSNLVFMEGSSDDLPQVEGPYDLVFSNYVMHWIKDRESSFRNIHRSLAVGGRMAFIAAQDTTPLAYQVAELMGHQGLPFLHFVSLENCLKLADECGFVVEFKSVLPRRYTFSNIDAFLEWMSVGSNGKTDHLLMEPAALNRFKEPFGDQPVDMVPTMVTMILRKP